MPGPKSLAGPRRPVGFKPATYSVPAYTGVYFLDAEVDDKSEWEETPAGTGTNVLYRGVRAPEIPDTSRFISEATQGEITRVFCFSRQLAPDETVTSVRCWCYGNPGSRMFNVALKTTHNDDVLVEFMVAAGSPTGWYTLPYIGSLTQAQIDGLQIVLQAHPGSGACTVYTAYVELRCSKRVWDAGCRKIRHNLTADGFSVAAGFMGCDVWTSTDLGSGRSIFWGGDTLYATAGGQQKLFGTNANNPGAGRTAFVRNSVTLFTSYDVEAAPNPVTYIGADGDGNPDAYFPDIVVQGQPYHRWPSYGYRLDDKLFVSGAFIRNEPGQGDLAAGGYWAMLLDNISDTPNNWTQTELRPLGRGVQTMGHGDIGVIDHPDGYVYFWGIGPGLDRSVYRLPRARAKAGHVTGGEWWDGNAGWFRDRQHPLEHAHAGGRLQRRGGVWGTDIAGGPGSNAPVGGSVHRRADGTYQYSALFGFPFDIGLQLGYAKTPSTDIAPFPQYTTVFEIPDDEFFSYAAVWHPQMTWSGMGPNDQVWSYCMGGSGIMGGDSNIDTSGFPRFAKVYGIP